MSVINTGSQIEDEYRREGGTSQLLEQYRNCNQIVFFKCPILLHLLCVCTLLYKTLGLYISGTNEIVSIYKGAMKPNSHMIQLTLCNLIMAAHVIC